MGKMGRYLFLAICLFWGVSNPPCYAQQGLIVSSHPSGFYEDSIRLQLSTGDPDARIYYTLDGREPETHGVLYEGVLIFKDRSSEPNGISMVPTNPIRPGDTYREAWLPPVGKVAKLYALKARARLVDGAWGPIFTGHYILDSLGSGRHTLPLVSLLVEPDDFFGFEKGIYVPGATGGNYYERGEEWEREVEWAFFDEGDTLAIRQNLGVRIHGGTSRNRPRKSLRFYARSEYGKSWLDYPLFPDKPVDRYKTFLLRNGGNDWSESVFRDAFMHSLLKGSSNLDVQYARAVVAYINGEYWGVHHLRDRFDDRYLQSHYGLDPDSLVVLENRSVLAEGMEQGKADYDSLYHYITTRPLEQQPFFDEVERQVDVQNFIDYQCLQIFCRNTDWPGNNIAYWKSMAPFRQDSLHPRDGRWRWMVFDLDFGMGLDFDYVQQSGLAHGPNNAFHNTLRFALEESGSSWPNPPWSTAMFRSMLRNQGFMHRFASRYADLLNTVFNKDYTLFLLDSMEFVLRPEMERHIRRWNQPTWQRWENELVKMETFLKIRPDVQLAQVDREFELGGLDTLQVDVIGKGFIVLNTIQIREGRKGIPDPVFPWTGRYFRDVPVRLIAKPEAGYRFSHWEGVPDGESDTLFVMPGSVGRIVAHFEEEDRFEGDAMNPPAHALAEADYEFTSWEPDRVEGEFPPNMLFQQSRMDDPTLHIDMTDPYYIPYTNAQNNEYHANDQDKIGKVYGLTGRTRIEGLGEDGIAFINTGRKRDLGAAVLALDTRECGPVHIDWTAQTLQANSRVYHIRLQYRVGLQGEWTDMTDAGGRIADYQRDNSGVETTFGSIPLPVDALDQPYIQLRWKYYYTGLRLDPEDGSRDKLRLDDIRIRQVSSHTEDSRASTGSLRLTAFPNPFDHHCHVCFSLPQASEPVLDWFSSDGSRQGQIRPGLLPAGRHCIPLNATSMPAGISIARLTLPDLSAWVRLIRMP
jgi:hypothetical protein